MLFDLCRSTDFGLAFERLCLKNLPGLLTAAGFELNELISYGPFFRQSARKKKKSEGLQIDILLHRQGHILTVIECKFQTSPLGCSVIDEVEKRFLFFSPKKCTQWKKCWSAQAPSPEICSKAATSTKSSTLTLS